MKAESSNTRKVSRLARVIRRMVVALLWVLLASLTLWAVAALYFDVRISWLRLPLAVIYGLGMLAVWIWVRRPWKATGHRGRIPARAGLVAFLETFQRPGLAAGRGGAAVRGHRRQSGDDP